MNKWELLKSFILGMFYCAEVTGEKSIQRTLAKIIAQMDKLSQMDKLEKEEKESAAEIPAE